MPTNEWAQFITGRVTSCFAYDLEARWESIASELQFSSVLVVGAAGTIGSSLVRALLEFHPKALYLVDINENGMAEVVRDVRSGPHKPPADFRTFIVDIGTPTFDKLLCDRGPFQIIFNLAAMKHVRSERDPYTLSRMLTTNVLAVDWMLKLAMSSGTRRYFSVSTDKAHEPQNMLGASKYLMENTLWAYRHAMHVSTARFPNVAFSSGSIFESVLLRVQKGQPVAAPTGIWRFFISPQEAAQFCLLACFDGDMMTPKPAAIGDAVEITSAIGKILRLMGRSGWPCIFRPATTTGEKQLEFVGPPLCALSTHTDRYNAIDVSTVAVSAWSAPLLIEIRRRLKGGVALGAELVDMFTKHMPTFGHMETGRSLDDAP